MYDLKKIDNYGALTLLRKKYISKLTSCAYDKVSSLKPKLGWTNNMSKQWPMGLIENIGLIGYKILILDK